MPTKKKIPVTPPPIWPEPGETWKYRDGTKYEVIAIAESPPSIESNGLFVVYKNEAGKILCCPILFWQVGSKLEEKSPITFEEYKLLGPERVIIPEFELRIMEERVGVEKELK